MQRHRRFARVSVSATAILIAGLAAAVPTALAQDTLQPFIVYEHAPMNTWLVDEKDAALRQALSMIPARLSELPGEFPDMPKEVEPLIQLALRTLAQPARFAVTYNPDNASGGFFGYGMTMSVQARGKEHASELHALLNSAIAKKAEEDGMPLPIDSVRFSGMKEFALPFGLISFGPRESKDGWRYELVVGAVDSPDAGFDRLPAAPPGMSPVMRASLNMAALTPGINMARTLAGQKMPPEAAEAIAALEAGGLIGAEAISVDYVAGFTPTESLGVTRVRGAGKYADAWHMSRDPIAARDLAMVPADATMLSIAKGDLSSLVDVIDTLAERGMPVNDFLDEFNAQTGVDLKADILEAVGGTWGAYLSDTTGGGSLGSAVLFASLKDRARFAGAHRKLVSKAKSLLAEQERGMYIRPRIWNDGEVELTTLQFPGMPVPLEVTYALAGDWLVMGLTPQAVVAASRQATGHGDAGVASNPAFLSAVPKDRSLTSLTFVDTARGVRAGYPIVSMAGSAFANLARSPRGDRDIGLVVPVYQDLIKGVKPMVQFSYWDGEDLVSESHADRSALVNAAGALGSGATFWPLLIAIPAIAEGAKEGRFSALDLPWEGIRNVAGRRTALAMLASPESFIDPVRRQASMAMIGLVWQLG